VAPPSSNASRPGRALAVLAALVVVLLLAILGSDLASPGSWSKNFRVHLGLDLTSGTTVELRAVVHVLPAQEETHQVGGRDRLGLVSSGHASVPGRRPASR